LVISTLHTNSAAGAIPRFLSMGVKPFLLSPALNAIIGQRLVRRVCQSCKTADTLDEATLLQIDELLKTLQPEDLGEFDKKTAKELPFVKGGGCEACHGLGFKGRIGIYEIMTMSKEIEKLISSSQVSEYALQEVAIKEGMITMVQDGILKAARGVTTIDEVFRVAKSLQ
jgi:type II secretory ATPase GspE/PulE/Tfp pilus assembly ATPase PilB-like protein